MLSAVARRAGAARATSAAAVLLRPTGQAASAAPKALLACSQQKATFFGRLWNANMKTEIPDSHATGAEAREMDEVAFNREPVHPPKGAGTKGKPIEVPSEFSQRAVGYEDPETHAVYWFNLKRGNLAYVAEIDMYFKLVDSPEFEEV